MNFEGQQLWTRAQLHGAGMTDSDIRRELSRGIITAVRPGVYLSTEEFMALSAESRHLKCVRAASLSTDGVVSHQSAALVHGFRLWNPDLRLVHMTVGPSSTGRRTTRRHVHSAPLGAADIVEVDGIAVTSSARTVADLSRTLSFEAAVCLGDSALRLGKVTRTEIVEALLSLPVRGRKPALAAVDFFDGLSETVGESRSRVMLRTFQFPSPELQVELFTVDGRLIARTDFLVEEYGVIGEFDGQVKYTVHVPAGKTAGDVVFQEKRREDELRAHGWIVVRWTWADLATPHVLAARIRKAFEIAKSMPKPTTVRRS
ncbi:hypothetical protein ACNHUS_04305 [Actinomycetes bacterium M1A6_2h]